MYKYQQQNQNKKQKPNFLSININNKIKTKAREGNKKRGELKKGEDITKERGLHHHFIHLSPLTTNNQQTTKI